MLALCVGCAKTTKVNHPALSDCYKPNFYTMNSNQSRSSADRQRLQSMFVQVGRHLISAAADAFFAAEEQPQLAAPVPDPTYAPARPYPIPPSAPANTPPPTSDTLEPATAPFSDATHFSSSTKSDLDDDASQSAPAIDSVAATFDSVWPDGDISFDVPANQIVSGTVFFGWPFLMRNSQKIKDGTMRRYFHCLGIFQCPSCPFIARPLNPTKKSKFCAPLPSKCVCPQHPDLPLDWVKCGSGQENPCELVLNISFIDGSVHALHKGTHGHPQPPSKKAHPSSLSKLKEIVKTNPDAGPA